MIVAELIAELKTMDQGVEVLIDLGDGLVEITGIDRGMVKVDDSADEDWAYVLSTTETREHEDAEARAQLEKMGHRFTNL